MAVGGISGNMSALEYIYKSHQNNADLERFEKYIKNKDKSSKDGKAQKDSEDTRTEVLVKPDGSKIMVVTVNIGGMEAVTSVEIAKPDKGQESFLERDMLRNFGTNMPEEIKNIMIQNNEELKTIINQKGDK